MQSNTIKGCSLRADSLWISSASSSLPVPDSPKIKTVLSEAAACSAKWKTWRINGVRPILLPNCSRALIVNSGRSCTNGTIMRVRPSCTSVFGDKRAEETFTPSIAVPLVEPKSLMTRAPLSSSVISQWRRDTVESAIDSSFVNPDPMVYGNFKIMYSRPSSGPAVTNNLGF